MNPLSIYLLKFKDWSLQLNAKKFSLTWWQKHNHFSFIENYTKTTTQSMQTHWMMGADANQYDWSTTIISRNCPFFPKILAEETAPNMGIQLQHIWWNHHYFFSSSITPYVLHIQLYEPPNNNYIYQILYRFYNII